MEEAQHAKLDTLLIDEIAETATLEERETAVDELLELGEAIDGLLLQQIKLNIETLQNATGRRFTEAEKEEISTRPTVPGDGLSLYRDWSIPTLST